MLNFITPSVPKFNSIVDTIEDFRSDFKEAFIVRRSLNLSKGNIPLQEMSFIEFSENDTPIYFHNDLLILTGIPSRIPGAVSGKLTSGETVIFVNDKMLKEEESFYKAAISHEEGHISLKHNTRKPILNTIIGWFFTSDSEYEADIYAHRKGHDVLSMLKTAQRDYGYDMKDRIDRLERYIEVTK